MNMTRRLTRHLTEQVLTNWPDGPRCFAAGISGGADSVCLLHLMVSVSRVLGFTLTAVHVNHGIRGQKADEDASFVEALCVSLGVAFLEIRVNAPALVAQAGLSLEDAARRLRHEALHASAVRLGADAVALAHHRDDQAETVLLNLLRGAATEGLCGMRSLRNGLFRPFLSISASELRDCLKENGWIWREDDTNKDETYRRNALRHRFIPLLREGLGQDPTGPLIRFAAIQQQEQAFMSELAGKAADSVELQGINPCGVHQGTDPQDQSEEGRWPSEEETAHVRKGSRFLHEALSSLPDVLARRVLFLAWEQATGQRCNLEYVHADALLGLCRTGRFGSRLSLPGKMEAILDGEWCTLQSEKSPRPVVLWQTAVKWPVHPDGIVLNQVPEAEGILSIEAVTLEQALWKYGPSLRGKEGGNSQLIDSSRVSAGIYLRNRRSGDAFRPWNSPGERTLKEWFVDRKIPSPQRVGIPLLADGNRILWVLGYRTAGELCASGLENELYELTWIPENNR